MLGDGDLVEDIEVTKNNNQHYWKSKIITSSNCCISSQEL